MWTINLIKISSTFHVRNFLYASSSSVYGSNSKVPFCENDEVVSQISPYALTKRACELWAKYFHQTSGLPITGFRFFTVYVSYYNFFFFFFFFGFFFLKKIFL